MTSCVLSDGAGNMVCGSGNLRDGFRLYTSVGPLAVISNTHFPALKLGRIHERLNPLACGVARTASIRSEVWRFPQRHQVPARKGPVLRSSNTAAYRLLVVLPCLRFAS